MRELAVASRFSLIFVLIGLASCNDSSNSQSDAYYYPMVVAEAKLIRNPSGASVSETSGHKYGSAWVRRVINADAGKDEVRTFLDSQLSLLGWTRSTLAKGRSTTGFSELDYYCKGATETELAFQQTAQPAEYTALTLTIYWSSGDDGACIR